MSGFKFALKEVFMSNLIHAEISNKVLEAAYPLPELTNLFHSTLMP
jgi:hypothetical protein